MRWPSSHCKVTKAGPYFVPSDFAKSIRFDGCSTHRLWIHFIGSTPVLRRQHRVNFSVEFNQPVLSLFVHRIPFALTGHEVAFDGPTSQRIQVQAERHMQPAIELHGCVQNTWKQRIHPILGRPRPCEVNANAFSLGSYPNKNRTQRLEIKRLQTYRHHDKTLIPLIGIPLDGRLKRIKTSFVVGPQDNAHGMLQPRGKQLCKALPLFFRSQYHRRLQCNNRNRFQLIECLIHLSNDIRETLSLQ